MRIIVNTRNYSDVRLVSFCDLDELGLDSLHGLVDSEFDLVRMAGREG